VVIAEKELIAQIRRMSSWRRNSSILSGIGDDCAVLRVQPGRGRRQEKENDTLITTDFSLDGIHFRRDWHSAESIGHRCLARGLSDIAAMGGEPVAAFLSLALPRDLPRSWVGRFMRSLIGLGKKYGVVQAGGDTAESAKGVLADIVVLGAVPKGEAVLRSTARLGDGIYVSGELGGSAAAIAALQNPARKKPKLNPPDYPRHFFPQPRVELGRMLREKGLASAMIDTSDGLSTDLAHICEESHVGAEIEADLIPRASVGKPARRVDLELALHGGEDYELLFTVPGVRLVPSRMAGVRITRIGTIITKRKIFLLNSSGEKQELEPRGWEHFRK
jgi:thiamine-monophosphate kinase